MRFTRIVVLFAAIVSVAAPVISQTRADSDTQAIERLISDYAKSVSLADTALAERLWQNADSVTFIHPLGHERGWPAIKKNVYENLMGALFSVRDLKIERPSIHVSGNSGWSEFYWTFNATLKENGSPAVTRGRETQIYQRENGQWRIVHVHYSGMPETRTGP
jgi:ketosteroid isomerase-like protein